MITKPIIKLIAGTFLGGFLGYLYYYFIGCQGGCPITSNWITSVIYGAVFGLILFLPTKGTKNAKDKQKHNN